MVVVELRSFSLSFVGLQPRQWLRDGGLASCGYEGALQSSLRCGVVTWWIAVGPHNGTLAFAPVREVCW